MFYDLFDFITFYILIMEIFMVSFNLDIVTSIRKIVAMFVVDLLLVSLFHILLPDYNFIFMDFIICINMLEIFKNGVLKTIAAYTFVCLLVYQLEIGLYDLLVTIFNLCKTNINYSAIDYFVMLFPLIAYTVFFVISRKRNNKAQITKRYTFEVFVFAEIIVTLVILCFDKIFYELLQQKNIEESFYTYRTSSFVAFILALVGFIISHIIVQNIQYREQIKINNQLLVQQKVYFENMIKKEEDTKKLRHDLKHHITILEQYISSGENQAALHYLDTMYGKLPFHKLNYSCNNAILDSILSVYQKQFEDNGISVTIKGVYPEDIKIDDFDLCVIFSNLLLNAVEACTKIENKDNRKIDISINSYGIYVNIIVENTYAVISPSLHTLKKDMNNHGFGLKSVKDSVENNNGKLEISHDEDMFCVDVLLQGNVHLNETN